MHQPTGGLRLLLKLKGIGDNAAWLYVMEFFAWREFHNRREVGALAGLTPTPFQSGDEDHEQGTPVLLRVCAACPGSAERAGGASVSKAGNDLVRAMAIEIAWGWLRFQPDSALAKWYQERFGAGGKRLHKTYGERSRMT